jgi:hypothetical protein
MLIAILLVTVFVVDELTAVDASTLPVAAGSVSVFVPAAAGTSSVMSPDVAPLSLRGMFSLD